MPSDETALERELLQAADDTDILARMVATMGHAADVIGLTARAAALRARAAHVRECRDVVSAPATCPGDLEGRWWVEHLAGPLPAPAEGPKVPKLASPEQRARALNRLAVLKGATPAPAEALHNMADHRGYVEICDHQDCKAEVARQAAPPAVDPWEAALLEIGGTTDEDKMCLHCLRWVSECDHLLLHPEQIIRERDPRRCVGAIARRALASRGATPPARDPK